MHPTKQPTKQPTKHLTKTPTKSPTKTTTMAPIIACGNSSIYIASYINSVTLSNKSLSLSGNTSLDRALQNLIASNNKTGVQLSTCNPADKYRLRQRFAYFALVFSGGKDLVTDWYADPNECQWKGIFCNANKTVNRLNLIGQGLAGIFPDDVGLWTGLQYLDVGLNQLGGTLPSSIGAWTGLVYFDASDNQLVGSLPSSIGAWTGLTNFIVYKNQLTGTVPKEVSNWASIKLAYLYSNKFNGTMPVIGIDFCPRTNTLRKYVLYADCTEIVCSCCNFCA
jgi:hypothetical protein